METTTTIIIIIIIIIIIRIMKGQDRLSKLIYIYIYTHTQGVTGGTDQTSGECSLGQTIPI